MQTEGLSLNPPSCLSQYRSGLVTKRPFYLPVSSKRWKVEVFWCRCGQSDNLGNKTLDQNQTAVPETHGGHNIVPAPAQGQWQIMG